MTGNSNVSGTYRKQPGDERHTPTIREYIPERAPKARSASRLRREHPLQCLGLDPQRRRSLSGAK